MFRNKNVCRNWKIFKKLVHKDFARVLIQNSSDLKSHVGEDS